MARKKTKTSRVNLRILLNLIASVVVLLPLVARSETVAVKNLDLVYRSKTHALDFFSVPSPSTPRPGIILLPEFWGRDELETEVANRLANEGYAVMILDLYGSRQHTKKMKEAERLQAKFEKEGATANLDLIRQALAVLKERPEVDKTHLGAVGLGYGGGLLLDFAKDGKSGLKALVSFYGGVLHMRPASQVGTLPSVLYIRPEFDNYTSDADFKMFQLDIKKTDLRVEFYLAKDAHYGFINKDVDSYGGDDGNTFMFFEPKAAESAWKTVSEFLKRSLK